MGAALLTLFESSQVDAKLPGKHGARAAEFPARAANKFCINFRQRVRRLHRLRRFSRGRITLFRHCCLYCNPVFAPGFLLVFRLPTR